MMKALSPTLRRRETMLLEQLLWCWDIRYSEESLLYANTPCKHQDMSVAVAATPARWINKPRFS
jgi:hypothetical protein